MDKILSLALTTLTLFWITGCSVIHPVKKPISPIKHAKTHPPSIKQMKLETIQGIEQKNRGFYWCDDCGKLTPKFIQANQKKSKEAVYRTHLTVYFDFNQSQLTAKAKAKLKQWLENILLTHPVTIHIKGYTDSISSISINQSLAMHRVNTVKTLVQSMMSNNQVSSLVTYQTSAHGKCCYVRMPSNSAINRRVEVIIKKGDE